MSQRVRTAAAATGATALAYVVYREISHLATRRRKLEALGRVGGRWQRADLDRMVRCDPKRLRRMLRALLLGAAPEDISDERLRRAFRYAERPDDASKSTAPVDRYVALAKSCSRALDEPGDGGSGRGEPRVGRACDAGRQHAECPGHDARQRQAEGRVRPELRLAATTSAVAGLVERPRAAPGQRDVAVDGRRRL